jgi:hypothetical protein
VGKGCGTGIEPATDGGLMGAANNEPAAEQSIEDDAGHGDPFR